MPEHGRAPAAVHEFGDGRAGVAFKQQSRVTGAVLGRCRRAAAGEVERRGAREKVHVAQRRHMGAGGFRQRAVALGDVDWRSACREQGALLFRRELHPLGFDARVLRLKFHQHFGQEDGTIAALVVTRTNPEAASKAFFNGMGKGYGNIIGIIIAAGVFASGLRACGVVDAVVNYLTHASEIARVGAAVGPFLLGIFTGSGDASAFAFNEAVTVHAGEFGLTVHGLGMLAVLSAALGRMASPLAGGLILSTGFAGGVSPLDVVKRTAPAALVLLAATYGLY